jgi:hypothetical protein
MYADRKTPATDASRPGAWPNASKERRHDLTFRFLSWLLSLFTPRPRGRHRLHATEPPLRFIPSPPPRFTEILDGNASRLVRPYTSDPYLRTAAHTPCPSTPTERHHRQRARHRALYLTTLGIDTAAAPVHGVSAGTAPTR